METAQRVTANAYASTVSGEQDLGGLYEEVVATAEQQGLVVFPGLPHSETGFEVDWPGTIRDFVAFAASIPIRVLYAQALQLDAPAIEEIEDELRDDAGELAPEDAAAIASARNRLRDVVLVGAAFAIEGIVHRVDVEARWWAELRDRVSISHFAESAVRSSARQHGRDELDAFGQRHEELVAKLAQLQPFYSAVNDDDRRRAAAEADDDMRRFLDPAIRRDANLGIGYSIALDIIRSAAGKVRTDVKPRIVRDALATMPERAARHANEFISLRTKDERRRRARALLEAELGFASAELVDAFVNAADSH